MFIHIVTASAAAAVAARADLNLIHLKSVPSIKWTMTSTFMKNIIGLSERRRFAVLRRYFQYLEIVLKSIGIKIECARAHTIIFLHVGLCFSATAVLVFICIFFFFSPLPLWTFIYWLLLFEIRIKWDTYWSNLLIEDLFGHKGRHF